MEFLIGIIVQVLIFILLAMSFNLLYGYTNMMFLGTIGMLAIGAYAAGLMTLAGVSFWLAMPFAVIFCMITGLLLSLPTVRFKGDFLAIVTLGFGEIIRSVITNWVGLTRGPLGLPGITRPSLFNMSLDNEMAYLTFVAITVAIVTCLYYRLTHSPFGRILETIREDDTASKSIGKNINKYRIQVIVIASAVIGLAGVLNVHFVRFTDPSVYSLEALGLILLAVFAGGPGHFWGSVVAGAILIFIRDAFLLLDFAPTIIGPLRWAILSSILVAVLIYRPNGFFGKKFVRKNY